MTVAASSACAAWIAAPGVATASLNMGCAAAVQRRNRRAHLASATQRPPRLPRPAPAAAAKPRQRVREGEDPSRVELDGAVSHAGNGGRRQRRLGSLQPQRQPRHRGSGPERGRRAAIDAEVAGVVGLRPGRPGAPQLGSCGGVWGRAVAICVVWSVQVVAGGSGVFPRPWGTRNHTLHDLDRQGRALAFARLHARVRSSRIHGPLATLGPPAP